MQYSLSFRLKSYAKWAFDKTIGIGTIKSFIKYRAAYNIYKQEDGPKYNSKEADTVVWLYYADKKLRRNLFVWDILLVAAVAKSKNRFQLHWGKDIERFHNKTILYTLNKDRFNYLGFENYALAHQHISQTLEAQGNTVYPSYANVLYWENKIYMYSKFAELGIHTPRTVFYDNFSKLEQSETTFPFLIKVPHSSGSFGLFNVKDAAYLHSLANDPIILENKMFIVQERLNITMDMRVILTGDEITHFYWRKNKDKSKWHTTSTSGGSSVDFTGFPEQWRQYIIDAFKKMDLITGAFDIGWQNDDLSTEPYFFEVSPSYDVNPTVDIPEYLNDYGKYKKKLLFKNSFDKLFIDETFRIKSKAVLLFMEQVKKGKK